MKSRLLILSLSALFAAACNKPEISTEQPHPKPVDPPAVVDTFRLEVKTIAERVIETKSVLLSDTVMWNTSDVLFVFGAKASDIKQAVLSPEFTVSCDTGVFSYPSWPEDYIPLYAVNSNGAKNNPSRLTCTAAGKITAFINPKQTIMNAGSYGQTASASVGAVEKINDRYVAKMMNIPSFFRFRVERKDITEIKIESKGGENIAGYVEVDYSALSSAAKSFWTISEGEKSIDVRASGSASAEDCFLPQSEYVICLLPQSYSQGLKIRMKTSDGSTGVREIAGPVDLSRSVFYDTKTALDDGVSFQPKREKIILDFTSITASTFKYDVGGTATDLPKRTSDCIPAGTDFWGAAYPQYKFNGAVRFWNSSLNMLKSQYIRFPRITDYKLTAITDVKVVHTSSRGYKITSSTASGYADGIPVKGGEEQSLTSGSAATSFILKDGYDAQKDYYIVCNSEAGFVFKLEYTPDDQLDPEPESIGPVTVARWRIRSTDLTTTKLGIWNTDNRFYALTGDYANEAYISTSSGPTRTSKADQLAVGNIKSGDAVMFTVPVSDLPAGSSVDFMTTLRAESSNIPKYWIFEYYEEGSWKTVDADLKTASDNNNVKYSLFMTTEDDLFTSFCQSYTTGTAIEGKGELKMRLRAVGSINCSGGAISASSSACLCFASYSNYYASCEIAVYRGIPVKDSKKVLFIGNSYTYYNASYFMFKEIARSQGHELRLRATIKGGEDMSKHINYVHVGEAISEGGYDYAFLQESALYVARYFDGNRSATFTNVKAMVDKIHKTVPSAKCSIEDCWASPKEDGKWAGYGSHSVFQRSLLGGALSIASQTSSWITPVGVAFLRAYNGGFTDLWSTADYSHPSLYGSYIKAVTFYYLVYGEELDENVPDCGINSQTAEILRGYARSAVMDKGNRAKCMAPDIKDIDTF